MKKTISLRLDEDVAAVLHYISDEYDISQSEICDRGIRTELLRIMSSEKRTDIKTEYEKWKAINENK